MNLAKHLQKTGETIKELCGKRKMKPIAPLRGISWKRAQ